MKCGGAKVLSRCRGVVAEMQVWWCRCRSAEVLRFNINRGDCAGGCAGAKEQVQSR